jgi:hypothetical protein
MRNPVMKAQIKSLFFQLGVILLLSACTSRSTPASTPPEVTQLVEEFGQKLQAVSLLSPNVRDELSGAYSEYVSPELLEVWLSDPSQAPGRIVSSPWPDRIEITAVSQISQNEYLVSGEIIEVTSSELVDGGAANRIPVRATVQRLNGEWRITEFILKT